MISLLLFACLLAFQVDLGQSYRSNASFVRVTATPSYEEGCSSYSTLSDGSRSIFKRSYWCQGNDNHLSGWYRFTGGAGDRMLDHCPLGRLNGSYACGAYQMGWISGHDPHRSEGAVKRNVSFAQGSNCFASSQLIKVQNCGGFLVYQLRRAGFYSCHRYCGYNGTSSKETSSSVPPVQPTTPVSQKTDGCAAYQVLSDRTRAVTYGDWSYGRCDTKLYGWYRFTGDAGNRMLDYCPLSMRGSSYNRCGTAMQGWITSGSMPSKYEGEVSRMVCFSHSSSCRCQYQKQIKVRNCGTFYVYWLEGVPVCNQRYCGVKDKSATVSCSENYMRIDLERNVFNISAYSAITLKDSNCKATSSRSYISLGTIPSRCGSKREETYDHIIYKNEVNMIAKPTKGLITRENNMRISFMCSYKKTGNVSFVSFKPLSEVNVTAGVGFGSFTYYFRMYTDRKYTTVHSYFPVQVKLRDWLYFEAYASVADQRLVVLIDQCYSTPTMDRNHPDKYVFINDRCPTDNTVQFYQSRPNRQRFSLQSYRYAKKSTAIYIHCVVFICHKASESDRCKAGCNGNNINRVKRDLEGGAGYSRNDETYTRYTLIEVGPIAYDTGIDGPAKSSEGFSFSTTTLLLIVGVAILVVVVAILLVKMRRNRNASGDTARKTELEIGIDHAPGGREYVVTDEVNGETKDGKRQEESL